MWDRRTARLHSPMVAKTAPVPVPQRAQTYTERPELDVPSDCKHQSAPIELSMGTGRAHHKERGGWCRAARSVRDGPKPCRSCRTLAGALADHREVDQLMLGKAVGDLIMQRLVAVLAAVAAGRPGLRKRGWVCR